ncbi:hypothetical protein RA280_20125 [Cupriavidus sp. CV2]|uniref:hypothetical protein n=1 Tax=Cupriavidus ulmosensis TaxID=3065913 RepID=UPI00296AF8BE|nr:hypothetical protein [Cupriavidus sp. CV2]MDW3684011.1 hypothetical protein [Cupriavidus sp. CV2]
MSVADHATTIAEFRDSGNTPSQTKAVLAQSNPYGRDDRQWESAITDRIYASKVKPWNAPALALTVCQPQQQAKDYNDPRNSIGFDRVPPKAQAAAIRRYDEEHGNGPVVPMEKCPYSARSYGGGMYECVKSTQQKAADEAQAEKSRETNYRDSFNRIESIPGVCTGEDCKRIIKIQRWDAKTGAMLN